MKKNKVCVDHNGNVFASFNDMCDAYGLAPRVVERRLALGHSLEESLLTKGRIKPIRSSIVSHIGETAKQRNGHIATIIEYRAYNDITVSFEDGTIVKCSDYRAFCMGHITGLTRKELQEISANKRLNSFVNTPDGRATCIEYENINNLTIRFKGGKIYKNIPENVFYSKHFCMAMAEDVSMNRGKVKDHLGNSYKTINEMLAVYGVDRQVFYKRKKAGKPLEECLTRKRRDDHIKRVGESLMQKNGHKATIYKYNSSTDISVYWDDDKTLVTEGIRYGTFTDGYASLLGSKVIEEVEEVLTPHNLESLMTLSTFPIPMEADASNEEREFRSKYINQIKEQMYGLRAVIVGGTNEENMIVRFEDGTIVTDVNINAFNSGAIAHPEFIMQNPFRNFNGYKIVSMPALKTATSIYKAQNLDTNEICNVTLDYMIEHPTKSKKYNRDLPSFALLKLQCRDMFREPEIIRDEDIIELK